MDIHRFVNMITHKRDVHITETNHEREKEMVHMHEIHDVPENRMCHRKSRWANISRRS